MLIHFSSPMIALGLVVMFAMAYAEGANDVAKVVATLVASGVTNYRRAIFFGAICTAIGAIAAVVLGREVAVTLTAGLVRSPALVNEAFALAALIGAMGWVLVATRMGVPVSASHAIVGAVIILGTFVFDAGQIRWDAVWWRIVIPMTVSPLLAIPLALILYLAFRPLAGRSSLATSHWLSAGAASFARGINDAPKMVALGAFFYLTSDQGWSGVPVVMLFTIVALGMTLGSLMAGRRVTETLAQRVTKMDHAEGLAANATTASLLIFASHLGLPASVTHVISSSIIGLGMRRAIQDVSWRMVRRMAVAWLVTLPFSGLLASFSYLLIHSWMPRQQAIGEVVGRLLTMVFA